MNKKNYLVGLYILILPVLLFLDTANLRQINNKTIIFILISILIIFFLILILIKIYSLIFKVKVNLHSDIQAEINIQVDAEENTK